MDEQMTSLVRSAETAIKPLRKWSVIRQTRTRRLMGDPGELYPKGKTFFGEWIAAGWIKNYDEPRWVKLADCEEIDGATPLPPPPDHPTNTKWVLGDYELATSSIPAVRKLARKRPNVPGQPQTVNMACLRYGLVPASDDYIRITRALNGDIDFATLVGIMDSWTPKGAKWRDGDYKVPCEIIFASNPVNVIASLRNPGGLTGIKGGEWIWQIDTLPYDTLGNYTAETIPSKYIMHFTVSKNGSPIVNPSPALAGRDEIPVKLPVTSKSIMYLRLGLLDSIGARTNRYNPPWDKGVF
jgi:hypothetical protein